MSSNRWVRVSLILAGLLACAQLLWPPARAAEGDQEALLRVLREGAVEERREALLALAERGNLSSVALVAEVLRDRDLVARKLAEQALWSIWSRSGDEQTDVLLQRGSLLLSQGQLARAVGMFDQVVERRPEFAEGYNKRATALYHLGEYARSLADIDETLRRNPYHFGALSGAGLCLIELKKYEQALGFLERALKINPNLDNIRDLGRVLRHKLNKPVI
jgi:tetratricopeptide (TPR) repeat protein